MSAFLDGTNDAFSVTTAAINNERGTFLAWYKPGFLPSAATNRYFCDGDNNPRHYLLHANSGVNTLDAYIDGRTTVFDTTGAWRTDEWMPLVYLYDKTGNVQRLFINGIERAVNSASGTWSSSALGTNFFIGQRFTGVSRFLGAVAEFATYSRILSMRDVAAFCNRVSPFVLGQGALISHWDLVAGSGNAKFGANDLTAVGTPTAAEHPLVKTVRSRRIPTINHAEEVSVDIRRTGSDIL